MFSFLSQIFFFPFSLTILNHWHLPLCCSRQRIRSHLWVITFFSFLSTLIHQQVLFATSKISENHLPTKLLPRGSKLLLAIARITSIVSHLASLYPLLRLHLCPQFILHVSARMVFLKKDYGSS